MFNHRPTFAVVYRYLSSATRKQPPQFMCIEQGAGFKNDENALLKTQFYWFTVEITVPTQSLEKGEEFDQNRVKVTCVIW